MMAGIDTLKNKQASHPLKVMIAGFFSLVLTLGVARFSYTPLLPVMLDETFLSNASGGWLATINYIGYMSGALIAASISNLTLKDRLYRIGLIVAILTTVGMSVAENYVVWSIMRFFAGLSSAAGLLLGSGLIMNWLLKNGHRAELGIHFGGLGLGIAVSAAVTMLMVGKLDWMQQWQVFTVVGVILAIPAWLWLPKPENEANGIIKTSLIDNPPRKVWIRLLFAAYFCAGFGYVITATFLVTIIESQPALSGKGNLVWLVLGLAATPACFIWDRIARRIGELQALLIAYGINIVGIIIPAFDSSLAGMLISGFLFGATFIGIVSLMLTIVGKFFPTKPAKPMGKLTLSYGAAQIIAPAMSGMIAQTTGNYNTPLILAVVVMLIGMVILAVLRVQKKY